MPFQHTYRLPVNPEDLAAMAYAVLRFANSTKSLSEIVEAARSTGGGSHPDDESNGGRRSVTKA